MGEPVPNTAVDQIADALMKGGCPVDVQAWHKVARLPMKPGAQYEFVFAVQRELGHTPEQLTTDVTRVIERFAPGAEVTSVRALPDYTARSKAFRREDLEGDTMPTVGGPATMVVAIVNYRGAHTSIPWPTHSGTTYLAGSYGNSCPVGAQYVLLEALEIGQAPPPEKGTLEKLTDAIEHAGKRAQKGASLAAFLAVVIGLGYLAVSTRREQKQ